ncbi:hypothetical protein [Flammeovirga pacifica]|uniref:Uncharacterized protein n=1 Tax=Flammeovirga pacifica TaxID=915059 RepID=A0A1S1YVS2_FLAPC|nr:hypothetical protein [Flammeovirga pacifica]OHX65131.1 hypothetical protein NH26_01555 [Flammeovirga pacifica]
MEKLQEQVIALYEEGLSYRKIGAEVGLSHGKVGEIIRGRASLKGNPPMDGTEHEQIHDDFVPTESTSKKLKKKSKKDKEAKAMKKQMAKMQSELQFYKDELEKSKSKTQELNGALEFQEKEGKLQQEIIEHFEEILAVDGVSMCNEEVLHVFNELWDWKREVSEAPKLFKAFKEEYFLVVKLSDYFEQGLRKFDENNSLETVKFNFSPEVVTEIESFI